MKKIKFSFQDYIIVIMIAASSLISQNIWSREGFEVIFRNLAELLIYTSAQSLILMLGAIDLSQQAMVNLTNYFFILLANKFGFTLGLLILLIFVGGLYFCIGYLIKKIRLDPFIVTLGLMFIYIGIADTFLSIGNNAGKIILADNNTETTLHSIFKQQIWGIPISSILLIVFILGIYWILLNKINLGLFIKAIGNDSTSAERMGIKNEMIFGITFCVSAITSTIGSVFETSRFFQGSPAMTSDLLFQSIGAAVLGGVYLTGGVGSVWRILRGVIIFVIAERSLGLTNWGSDIRQIILGILIILVIVVSSKKKEKEHES